MLNLFERYTTPLICLASFLVGVYVSVAWKDIVHAKQLRDIQAQVVKQEAYNRKTVAALQVVNAEADVKYNKLKEKLNATVLTNVPCKLTAAAVKLWNQSKGSESKLPDDPPRVVEAPSSSDSTATEGVGIKLVLENAQANDKICNELRDQLNGIIEWHDHTFGH